jgi:hypothetical protein
VNPSLCAVERHVERYPVSTFTLVSRAPGNWVGAVPLINGSMNEVKWLISPPLVGGWNCGLAMVALLHWRSEDQGTLEQ